MGRKVAWGNAENYVLSATYRLAAVNRSETGGQLMLIRGLLSNLKSKECNPGRLDATARHFPQDWSIISASQQAQRN